MTLSSGLNTEYATSMREAQGKGGKYWTSSGKSVDIYNDHMVTMNERFNDKIDVNIALGASLSRSYSRSHNITTEIDTAGIPNAFVPKTRPTSDRVIRMVVQQEQKIHMIIPTGQLLPLLQLHSVFGIKYM